METNKGSSQKEIKIEDKEIKKSCIYYMLNNLHN